MKPSRIALYTVIALVAVTIAYQVLVEEPPPGWPTNLIHLLVRH
jgi:hypothetical protein